MSAVIPKEWNEMRVSQWEERVKAAELVGLTGFTATPEEAFKLLTHLHLDATIKGTSAEGFYPAVTSAFLAALLKGVAPRFEEPPRQTLLTAATRLETLSQFHTNLPVKTLDQIPGKAQEVTAILKKLAPGEKFILPYGWSGTGLKDPGHAMLLEFFRVDKDLFDIRFYDTSGDQQSFAPTRKREHSTDQAVCRPFKKVPYAVLFPPGNESLLIQTLLEPRLVSLLDSKSARYNFDTARQLLNPFFPYEEPYTRFFMQSQQAGTCSEKSHEAWLRDNLADEALYRAATLEMKGLSLPTLYLILTKNRQLESREHRALHEALTFHKGSAAKILKEGNRYISPERLDTLVGMAIAIEHKLGPYNHTTALDSTPQPSHNLPKAALELSRRPKESNRSMVTGWSLTKPLFDPFPKDFSKIITDLRKTLTDLRKVDPMMAQYETERHLFALPDPTSSSWAQIPPTERLGVLKGLLDMGEAYVNQVTASNSWSFEATTLWYWLMAILHRLALLDDAKRPDSCKLGAYGITLPQESDLKDPYNVCWDPKLLPKREIAFNTLRAIVSRPLLFNWTTLHFNAFKIRHAETLPPDLKYASSWATVLGDLAPIISDEQFKGATEKWLGVLVDTETNPTILRRPEYLSWVVLKRWAMAGRVIFEKTYTWDYVPHTGMGLHHTTEGDTHPYYNMGNRQWPYEWRDFPAADSLHRAKVEDLPSPQREPRRADRNEGNWLLALKELGQPLSGLSIAQSSPPLTLYSLLSLYTSNAVTLLSPTERTRFNMMAFAWIAKRNADGNYKFLTPLQEAMRWSRPLERQFWRFIERGLTSSYHRRKDHPDFPSTLFFLETACHYWRFKLYQSVSPKPPFDIEQMLSDLAPLAHGSESDSSLLAGVEALWFATKCQQLDGELVGNDWVRFLSSWLIYRNGSIATQHLHRVIDRPIANTLSNFIGRFTDTDRLRQVATSVVQTLKLEQWIDGLANTSVQNKMPLYHLCNKGEDVLTLDLVVGRLYCKGGPLGSLRDPPFSSQATFKALFPKAPIDFRAIGQQACFKSPYGPTEVDIKAADDRWKPDQASKEGLPIRCHLQGESCSASIAEKQSSLPEPLKKPRWAHWLGKTSKTIWITDVETGKVAYALSKEGILTTLGSDQPISTGHGNPTLCAFEDPNYIFQSAKGPITFMRYQTLSGRRLEFPKSEAGDRVWSEAMQYALEPPQLIGSLSGFVNYLYLKSTGAEGSNRVLIPCRPVKALQNYAPATALELIEKEAQDEKIPKEPSDYWVLPYTLSSNGRLFPQSDEGWAYLAYLYLQRCQYREATVALRKIDTDHLPTKAMSVALELILDTEDGSPNAAAVKLQAELRLHKPSNPSLPSSYLHGLNKVNARAELTYEEELELLQRHETPSEELKRRLRELQHKSVGPLKSTQSYITKFEIPLQDIGDRSLPSDFYNNFAKPLAISTEPPKIDLVTPSSGDIDWYQFFWRTYRILKVGSNQEREHCQWRVVARWICRPTSCPSGVDTLCSLLRVFAEIPSKLLPDIPSPLTTTTARDFMHQLIELYKANSGKTVPSFPARHPSNAQITSEVGKGQRGIRPELKPLPQPLQYASSKLPVVSGPAVELSEPIEKWLKDQLVPITVEEPSLETAPRPKWFSLADQLPLEQRPYWQAYVEETKVFDEAFEAGKERLSARRFVNLPKGKEHALCFYLEDKLTTVHEQNDILESKLLHIANRKAGPNVRQQLYLESAGILMEVELEDLIGAFSNGTATAYRRLNGHLTDQEVAELHQTLFKYLELRKLAQRIERIKRIVAKLGALDEGLARRVKAQQLPESTSPLHCYDPSEYPLQLVMEVSGDFEIRPDQAKQLEAMLTCDAKGQPKSGVIEHPTGGGKSSVIASNLLRATPGATLVVHSCQYRSMVSNMRYFQGRVKQRILAVDDLVPRNTAQTENFSIPVLKKVLSRLDTAKEQGAGRIVTSRLRALLSLELERVSFGDPDPSHIERLQLLGQICMHFQEGHDIYDEPDQTLDLHSETITVTGEGSRLNPAEVLVMRELIACLVTDPALNSLTDLCKGKQTHLSAEQYSQELVVKLSKVFVLHWDGIDPLATYDKDERLKAYITTGFLPGEADLEIHAKDPPFLQHLRHLKSMERFLSETMESKLQAYVEGGPLPKELNNAINIQDLAFLVELKSDANSIIGKRRQRARLIALARGFIKVILKRSFLSKYHNLHYGRSTDGKRVVPFDAAGTPAETEFGNPLQAGVFHWLTALPGDFGLTQIQQYAELCLHFANRDVARWEQALNETADAIEFKKQTGQALTENLDQKSLEQALSHVKSNINALTNITAELALSQVSYFPTMLRADAYALAADGKTCRAMSATPWNSNIYASRLYDNRIPNPASGGVTLARLLQMHQKELPIVVSFTTLQEFFNQICPTKESRQTTAGLIESGGLLRQFSTFMVAQAAVHFFDTDVLYFEFGPGDKNPNTFAVLRKSDPNQFDLIGSTQRAAIEAKGVNCDKAFVIFDHNHSFGTDVEQRPDAVNIVTFNHSMLKSDAIQGTGRTRLYSMWQRVRMVIAAEEQNNFIGKGATAVDVLHTTVVTEAIRKGQDALPAYLGMSQAAVTNYGKRQLTAAAANLSTQNHKAYIELAAKWEPLMVTTMASDWYSLFGSLETTTDTIALIKSLKAQLEQQVAKSFGSVPPALQSELNAAIARAEKDPYLIKQLPSMETTGKEATVREVAVLTERDVAVELELELELAGHLQGYLQRPVGKERPERTWSDNSMKSFLTSSSPEKWSADGIAVYPLKETFAVKKGAGLAVHQTSYEVDLSPLFDQRILITNNYQLVTETALPVFHPVWRPAIYLLHVTGKVVLISQAEAVCWIEFLTAQQTLGLYKDVQVTNTEGIRMLGDDEGPALCTMNTTTIECLLQINALNGDIGYLLAHQEKTETWLKTDRTLTTNFLRLKVQNGDPKNRQMLYANFINKDEGHRTTLAGMKADKERTIASMSKEEVQAADPEMVPMLDASLIQYLLTKEQIAQVQLKQAKGLTEKQFDYITDDCIPGLAAALVARLDQRQAQLVAPTQVNDLTNANLGFLTRTDQIQAVDFKKLVHLNPSTYPQWTAGQIKSTHIKEALQYLKVDELVDLDDAQLALISAPQINGLTHKHLSAILRLSVDQLKGCKPEFWKGLADALNAKKAVLTSEQLITLTRCHNPLIGLLDKPLIALISDDVKKAAIATLTAQQFHEFTEEQAILLELLNPAQWLALNTTLLKAHADIIPIRTCEQLTFDYLDVIVCLEGRRINAVPSSVLAQVATSLEDPQLAVLTPNQWALIRLLDSSQRKKIPTEVLLICVINAEDNWVRTMGLEHADLVPYLTDFQLNHLPADLKKAMAAQQLEILGIKNSDALTGLALPQLMHITDKAAWKVAVEALPVEEFAQLTAEEHLPIMEQLVSTRLFTLPPPSRLLLLQKLATSSVIKELVQKLTQDELSKLDDRSFKVVVTYLSQEQVRGLPPTRWALLDDKGLKLIDREQFTNLTDKAVVPRLPANLLKYLPASMDPLPATSEQVKALTKKSVVPRLPQDRLIDLQPDLLIYLSATQIVNASPPLLEKLPGAVFVRLSQPQFQGIVKRLTPAQKQSLPASHRQWL